MRNNRALPFLFLPSILGVLCFFVLPFFLTLYRSFGSTAQGKTGYGLTNYISAVNNPMFRLGAGNFLLFALITVPAAMILSLALALLLKQVRKGFGFFLFSLLLPFVVPSGSTAFFWNSVFGLNGMINRFLFQNGFDIIMWDSNRCSILIPVVIYLWKFCGFLAFLFLIGLDNIPVEYYEIAKLEGAGRGVLFRKITLVYLTPTLILALLFSFVATFRISKELFMLFGKYPSENLYFFQHFISHQLDNMNLPVLSAAAISITAVISLVILPLWKIGKGSFDTFVKRGEGNPSQKGSGKEKLWCVLAFLLATAFLLPVLLTISNSFMSTTEVVGRFSPNASEQSIGILFRGSLHFVEPTMVPTRTTVEQYTKFLSDPLYLRMFWNSLLLVLPILFFHIVISIGAAYVFYRKKNRVMSVFLVGYILLTLLPLQATITPQYLFFQKLGLADSYLAVVLPAVFHPMGVCLICLQLQGFPAECIEAAQVNGAGELCILTKIVLPNIKGSVAILTAYTFAEYWNMVDQAVIFISREYLLPLSVYLSDLLQRDLGVLSAGSVIYLIPACLVFLTCLVWVKQGQEG